MEINERQKLKNDKEKKGNSFKNPFQMGCLVIFIKESSFKYKHANEGGGAKSRWKYAKINKKSKRTNDETMPNTI